MRGNLEGAAEAPTSSTPGDVPPRAADLQESNAAVATSDGAEPTGGVIPPAEPRNGPVLQAAKGLGWICSTCNRECVTIRSESRCLCGHRFKEHPLMDGTHRCQRPSCSCTSFFLIVAEGSWVLRCRCKHRHTDHDPMTHACKRANCQCQAFDSPWVCNCDHPWAEHRQEVVERKVVTIAGLTSATMAVEVSKTGLQVSNEVNRWELVMRGRE